MKTQSGSAEGTAASIYRPENGGNRLLRNVCNRQLHRDQETRARREHWSQVSRKFKLGTIGRGLSALRSGRSVLLDNVPAHSTKGWVAPEPTAVALKKTSE
jgi:hypothetical protein